MYRFGCLLLLVCLSAAAQEPPKARELLNHVAKTYRQATSYRVEAIVTNRILDGTAGLPLPGPARDELDVAFQAPDFLRVERGPNPRSVVVFPHSPDAGQFQPDFGAPRNLASDVDESLPLSQTPTNKTPDPKRLREQRLAGVGFADYAAIEDGLVNAETLRSEAVDFDGTAIPCWVIEGSYAGGVRRTFWVDTARNLVLREVELTPAKGADDGAQIEHTITVQKLVWNQPLNDLFTMRNPIRSSPPSPGPNGVTPTSPLSQCHDAGYTEEARIAHLSGTIMVDYTIDEQGVPTNVRPLNHLGLGLDELALSCVSESRFQPAQKDDHAIATHAKQTVPFNDRSVPASEWRLKEAVFHPRTGDARPVFLKAAYPETAGRPATYDSRGSAITVQLTIDGQGIPRDIQVSANVDPKWARQAAAIVSKWRFTPGLRDGQPAPMTATFLLAHGAY